MGNESHDLQNLFTTTSENTQQLLTLVCPECALASLEKVYSVKRVMVHFQDDTCR